MSKRRHSSDQAAHDGSDSGPRISLRPRSKVQRQSTIQWDTRGLHVTSPAVSGSARREEQNSGTTPLEQPDLTSVSPEVEPGKNVQEFKHLFNQMLKNPDMTLEKLAHPAFRDLLAYLNPAMLPWLSEAIEEARAAQPEGEGWSNHLRNF